MKSRRAVAQLAVVVAALVPSGCTDSLVPAVGPNAHVSIITTLERGDPAVQSLETSFQREVLTTRVERAFEVEVVTPRWFTERRQWKNLVFLSALDAGEGLARRIERLTGKAVYEELRDGRRPYAIYSDVWATGQTVMVIAAPDLDSLRDVSARYADALYDSLEARVESGLLRSLYIRGDLSELPGYLTHNYGFTIRVPKDYEVEEDRDSSMVFLHVGSPERWIFLHAEPLPREAFTAEVCLARRESLARHFYEGDYVLKGETRVEKTTFAGHPAFKFTGRWQNERHAGRPYGGPFRTYALHDGERLLLIDLLVFLPAKDKWPYLRQLEAIVSTFRLVPGRS